MTERVRPRSASRWGEWVMGSGARLDEDTCHSVLYRARSVVCVSCVAVQAHYFHEDVRTNVMKSLEQLVQCS